PRGWNCSGKSKLYLPPLRAYSGHDNPDRVADPVPGTAPLADQRLLVFDEIVEILRQCRDMHEPLDKQLLQLHEEAELGNSADKAGKLLADFSRHELNFLQLDNVPLRLHGHPFALAGMFADLRQGGRIPGER